MSTAQEKGLAELPSKSPVRQDTRSLTASDIRQRVNTIQEVMNAVMKRDVHYGVIPGCKKPSLYKPGSEVLLTTFQIATSIEVTDLSNDDCVRYQVRVVGKHAPTGMLLGEGIGECSSNEEKYKWRKAYDDEWNATPENRRRIKFGKYKDKQIRTEPADVANTILKMAKKRAQIDMTLTVTGASDCFDQDIEDLPEHLQQEAGESGGDGKAKLIPYPDDKFAVNLPAWTQLVESEPAKAGAAIAQIKHKLQTKYLLSEQQIKALDGLMPATKSTPAANPADSTADAEWLAAHNGEGQ